MNRMIELPYTLDALEPTISKETLDYHYNKHHKGYNDKLNKLIEKTSLDKKSLEYIVEHSVGELYNNAAQIWNHNFYWMCLTPKVTEMNKNFLKLIENEYESIDKFKEELIQAGVTHFGSGYLWLILKDKKLKIIHRSNAWTPIAKKEGTPLLTIDLWEHSYYIDYRNDKKKYLEEIWNILDWDFVGKNLKKKS